MTGYDDLATLIGNFGDLAIYRKFAALNSKRLLFMQAELLHLDAELQTIIELESKDAKKEKFRTYWKAFNDAPCEGDNNLQKQRFAKIGQKLDEYCK